ncbi:hypothetical protein [Aeromonas veronii]|uniref:hypothetical protein n=1 Tax=Aeromonas veronii TaxID=654 RepID=UPI003D1F498A
MAIELMDAAVGGGGGLLSAAAIFKWAISRVVKDLDAQLMEHSNKIDKLEDEIQQANIREARMDQRVGDQSGRIDKLDLKLDRMDEKIDRLLAATAK